MSEDWERIYTPHRMVYLRGGKKPKTTEAGKDCPFCIAPDLPEDEGLVFARGEHVYGVLNLYPYNSGHVMICPYRHIAEYPEINHEEMVELAEFTQRTMRILRKVATAQGFNVGMNQVRSPAPASPVTCTSTSFLAGVATRTSCRSSAKRR
jgi:ATP adenylyltransferase